jgi:hypothetical protein
MITTLILRGIFVSRMNKIYYLRAGAQYCRKLSSSAPCRAGQQLVHIDQLLLEMQVAAVGIL